MSCTQAWGAFFGLDSTPTSPKWAFWTPANKQGCSKLDVTYYQVKQTTYWVAGDRHGWDRQTVAWWAWPNIWKKKEQDRDGQALNCYKTKQENGQGGTFQQACRIPCPSLMDRMTCLFPLTRTGHLLGNLTNKWWQRRHVLMTFCAVDLQAEYLQSQTYMKFSSQAWGGMNNHGWTDSCFDL